MTLKTVILSTFLFFLICSQVTAANFVVTSGINLDDNLPGDGYCDTGALGEHHCTLKAAIQEANALPGPDTITFSQPLDIDTDTANLPAIGDELTIDGSNHWNTTDAPFPFPEIHLMGDIGLRISGDNNVIKGMAFTGNIGIRDTYIDEHNPSGNRIGGSGLHEGNVFVCNRGIDLIYGEEWNIQYNLFGGWDKSVPQSTVGYTSGIGIHVNYNGKNSVIEYNTIINHSSAGIFLEGGGPITIRNNVIGKKNVNDAYIAPNETGIYINGVDSATIINNTIAENFWAQIDGDHPANGAVYIQGNYIGSPYTHVEDYESPKHGIRIRVYNDPVHIVGNFIQHNNGDGIYVGNSPLNLDETFNISGNEIYINGGNGISINSWHTSDTPATIMLNDIYSNSLNGILLDDAVGVRILGNKIGWDYGEAGNKEHGIYIDGNSNGNLIGGPQEDAANYIGNNYYSGIFLNGTGVIDNYIAANIIGVSSKYVLGYLEGGNGHHGIAIYNGAESNNIGLWNDGLVYPNVIVDNNWRGIAIINSNNNKIIGNMVGTDGDTVNFGNKYSGIHVVGVNNLIEQNRVANNGYGPATPQAGIVIEGGTSCGNQITENSIYNNGANGIDLIDGANRTSPPLLSRTGSTLSGTACQNCLIEFFSGPDNDEGKFFEGSAYTDIFGKYSWEKTGRFKGPFVTATATSTYWNGTDMLDTSEFSLPVPGDKNFPWFLFLPSIIKKK